MSTRNDFYVRATNPKTIEALITKYPWARTQRGSDFYFVEQTDNDECRNEEMAALSARLKTDVIWLMYQSVSDSFQFHHWCQGRHIRSLIYGCYDEQYTWEEVRGVAEPWERKILFSSKRLKVELKYEEDEKNKKKIQQIFRDGTLRTGQRTPGVDARFFAWKIATHYRFPSWPRTTGFELEVKPKIDQRIRAGLNDKAVTERLLAFFRREFETEECTDFARLSRVPDSHVMSALAFYRSLNKRQRASFRDCCAHWAHVNYGFLVAAPEINHSEHPFFMKWALAYNYDISFQGRNAMTVQGLIQQYERDTRRGVKSAVTKSDYRFAKSVHLVKMPELRSRVPEALEPAGFLKADKYGGYCCRIGNSDFKVHVNYRDQLKYAVIPEEFKRVYPPKLFCFEQALGFGSGDWNCIVSENLNDTLLLLGELVRYCAELPGRIRAEFG